jgi:predicted amidohydrolase YtcJ
MLKDNCCNLPLKLLSEKFLMPRRMFMLGTGSLAATVALSGRRNAAKAETEATGESSFRQLAQAATQADTVYVNGTVVTVNDDQPEASAIAVKDGIIIAVGSSADIAPLQSDTTQVIDLQGKTVVPGFVDPHGHMFQQGVAAIVANLLPPPDGPIDDIPKLVAALEAWGETPAAAQIGWILGNGYDDSQLQELRHPTREDLDQVSTEVPIAIIHQSGHLGVLNSKGLELAGITADTPNPEGGIIRRQAGSNEPDGVLEETAFHEVLLTTVAGAAKITAEDAINIVKKGAETYASFGFTTAQEGRASQGVYEAIRAAGDAEPLPIDVNVYVDYVLHPDLHTWDVSRTYSNRVRLAGAKISLDGSPQGRTAWLTQPYYKVPEGQPEDYSGYATFPDEKAIDRVSSAYENNIQVIVHSNGDAAIDQFILAAREATQRYGQGDRRTTLIHGQTIREDQLDAMQELGLFPALFPAHVFYWGDWHRDVTIGPERANRISPTRSALNRGMKVTIHTDSPVVLPHATRTMWSAVNRRTRSGDILGADQRLTPLEALKAVTIWSAYQHFEEDRKGSIEVGKLADFAILSDNPLTVDPTTIRDIEVLETIKEGKTIYKADGESV